MRPMTPADCCLSKCQYLLQETDLRQSELGLLRGEEHRGLHRPGGDGADVCSQVRDRVHWYGDAGLSAQASQAAAGLSSGSEKQREKWRDKVSLSNKRGGGHRILYVWISTEILKVPNVKYSQLVLVRSVSCNSSMSKCNKTEDEEEYGPQPGEGGPDRGAPLLDSMFAKQPGECPPPPPPPNGNLSCSNPDLVQVTFNNLGYTEECRTGG